MDDDLVGSLQPGPSSRLELSTTTLSTETGRLQALGRFVGLRCYRVADGILSTLGAGLPTKLQEAELLLAQAMNAPEVVVGQDWPRGRA